MDQRGIMLFFLDSLFLAFSCTCASILLLCLVKAPGYIKGEGAHCLVVNLCLTNAIDDVGCLLDIEWIETAEIDGKLADRTSVNILLYAKSGVPSVLYHTVSHVVMGGL